MGMPEQLKLIALDADDLAVISAHVQDAHVQASDIVWRQDELKRAYEKARAERRDAVARPAAPVTH